MTTISVQVPAFMRALGLASTSGKIRMCISGISIKMKCRRRRGGSQDQGYIVFKDSAEHLCSLTGFW